MGWKIIKTQILVVHTLKNDKLNCAVVYVCHVLMGKFGLLG